MDNLKKESYNYHIYDVGNQYYIFFSSLIC